MSDPLPPTPEKTDQKTAEEIADETTAAKRYMVMNLVRVGSIVVVGLGIAIARELIALPYALGVALACAGLVAFFFAPVTLAKRWKARDRGEL